MTATVVNGFNRIVLAAAFFCSVPFNASAAYFPAGCTPDRERELADCADSIMSAFSDPDHVDQPEHLANGFE
jgi:hypothetical protein